MRCEYCDVEVVHYPENGICVCCGGKLPPRPAAKPVEAPVCQQAVYQQPASPPPVICPKCRSANVVSTTRGFSWGLALLGFCFLSIFGLPFGFCGKNKSRYQCCACGKKWKP